MACVETIATENADSEMEEGEIVDDLDELSDISSEEEFLLRQRLQVLENYNNVLERKKAKDSSFGPGRRKTDSLLQELSEISATELEDSFTNVSSKGSIVIYRNNKEQKQFKPHHKPKKKKDIEIQGLVKTKDLRKKVHRKKKLELKIISESSESEDEYRNKRRKLANAVAVNRVKNDKSSLHERLQKMLGNNTKNDVEHILPQEKVTETVTDVEHVSQSPFVMQAGDHVKEPIEFEPIDLINAQSSTELIDLCTDDDVAVIKVDETSQDTVDSARVEKTDNQNKKESGDSDEDLEMLRQHALKSKAIKTKSGPPLPNSEQQKQIDQPIEKPVATEKPLAMSEDEDSDTAELRLICLKSALLKKAIEMKQKQKLRKRLSQSQSSNLQDDFLEEYKELESRLRSENNTDIESVDMDIGSDVDDKTKDNSNNNNRIEEHIVNEQIHTESSKQKIISKDDELEEDEDLLRAKLLTSLSKNLPNLVDPALAKPVDEARPKAPSAPKIIIPENRIVINLGQSSDSEGENEATKNLTRMHAKLSEQMDFQQKLDLFLKSTRMEVERRKLPDVVQKSEKPTEKYVAKTVNHLPRSEQIEYKNLVRRMAELEKIKEARQLSMNSTNPLIKDTLKPRNVTTDTTTSAEINKIEEQIALSRKNIAEESSKMMKLKEEATKLSQKYKIVANELKNISTAITLNKREQRTVQNRLSKIRLQHQRLLNSSIHKHSKANGNFTMRNKPIVTSKQQKENNPVKEDYKNPGNIVKVVSHIEHTTLPNSRLSGHTDVTSSKEAIKNVLEKTDNLECKEKSDASLPVVEKGGGDTNKAVDEISDYKKDINDYKSPLEALDSANWDPNAILCPFEVGGNCKDPDCKFFHPKVPCQ